MQHVFYALFVWLRQNTAKSFLYARQPSQSSQPSPYYIAMPYTNTHTHTATRFGRWTNNDEETNKQVNYMYRSVRETSKIGSAFVVFYSPLLVFYTPPTQRHLCKSYAHLSPSSRNEWHLLNFPLHCNDSLGAFSNSEIVLVILVWFFACKTNDTRTRIRARVLRQENHNGKRKFFFHFQFFRLSFFASFYIMRWTWIVEIV